ncbi:MAG: hypothetical protein IJR53_09405 [Bacteroidales bacterium]|nr:hypothetical protein [Bacteroidales bacterium]
MAKETHKRIIVWLNQQGIENSLKFINFHIKESSRSFSRPAAAISLMRYTLREVLNKRKN